MSLTYGVVLGATAPALRLVETPALLSHGAVLVSAAPGGTWAPFSALPAKVVLTTRNEARHFVGDVAQYITPFNYAAGAPTDGGRRFVQKGARSTRVVDNRSGPAWWNTRRQLTLVGPS
jgi:hypothetical protein